MSDPLKMELKAVLKLDLSQVTPEAFLAALPPFPQQQIEQHVSEIEAITRSNLDSAAKWNSFLTILHTAVRVAAAS